MSRPARQRNEQPAPPRAAAAAASSSQQQHDDDDEPASGSRRDDDGDRSSGDDDDDRGDGGGGGAGGSSMRRKKSASAHSGAAGGGGGRNDPIVRRTVIHEALLRRAIHKDLATFYDSAVVPLESEIELEKQERLVLSYCNIYAIANLDGFEKLTHLQLDNNIIPRIGGLDHLVNLTWLDLSFNNIKVITGLDRLVKLTDLSLADNEITTISGLDNLTQLNVLSLGNNQIADLACVLPLRKFRNLRALNLRGNPVTQHDDYFNSVCAYLTGLKYLDHQVIEASQFARARDAKLDQILVLEAREKADEAGEIDRAAQVEQSRRLESANLGGMSSLFSDMLRLDPEFGKIKVLPGFSLLHAEYADTFGQVVQGFLEEMLGAHTAKEEERRQVQEVLDKIGGAAVEESRAELDRYAQMKKRSFRSHSESLARGHADRAVLPALKAELQQVVSDLLAVEMLLVEQVESVLTEFEKVYSKLIADNVLRINTAFRALMDAGSKHQSAVYELTSSLLERVAKGDDSLNQEEASVRALLHDKDVLNAAVSASHENQEGRVSAKEDEVREREEAAGKRLIKEMRDEQRARNRKRVAEIYGFKSIEEAAIAAQEAQQEDEDDA